MNDIFNDMNLNNSVMKDLNNLDFRKQNSREARERSLPKAGTDKAKIYNYLLHVAQGLPRNAKQISSFSNIDYHAVQRRMSELVRADLVEVAGKKDGYTLYKIKEVAK